MEKSFSASYAAAGVDVTAGYESVERIKAHVKRTTVPGVLGGIGGFGGMFQLPVNDYKEPVLVSGTDGVGTKLKIAFLMDKHDTVGIDCVAMCVNDVACSGAKPLFFLDYIACGKNFPEKIEQIVAGVAEGCVQAGCALVGGETAEMPGFIRRTSMTWPGSPLALAKRASWSAVRSCKPETHLSAWPPPAYILMAFLWCARCLTFLLSGCMCRCRSWARAWAKSC